MSRDQERGTFCDFHGGGGDDDDGDEEEEEEEEAEVVPAALIDDVRTSLLAPSHSSE